MGTANLELVVHTDLEDVGGCLPVVAYLERPVQSANGGLASEVHIQILRLDGPILTKGVFDASA